MREHDKRLKKLEQRKRQKDMKCKILKSRYPGQPLEEARKEAGLSDDYFIIFMNLISPNHSKETENDELPNGLSGSMKEEKQDIQNIITSHLPSVN